VQKASEAGQYVNVVTMDHSYSKYYYNN